MLEQWEQFKELLKMWVADDEFFEVVAQAHKKSFDALVKAGFTEDQAIRIVAGQSLGLKS